MTSAKALRVEVTAWEAGAPIQTADSRLVLDLYDREQEALRRYLYFLGLDRETAEETVQESFLKLHQHLRSGGERANLRAWLYRVSHNLARNLQVSFHAKRTEPLANAAGGNEPAAPAASAEAALLEREQGERLKRAVGQLSAAQRNCLALRSQGLKYREISETLGISVSTVGENVARGLEQLKELL